MKISNLKSIKNNLFFNFKNINKIYLANYKGKDIYTPTISKEWTNSLYFFNKRKNKDFSFIDSFIQKLIKEYFNMYNKILEKKIKLPILNNKKRINSGNKIWISKIETKHTNDIVIINIYVFNRKLNILIKKFQILLHKFYKKNIFRLKKKRNNSSVFLNIINIYINKLRDISFNLSKQKSIINKNIYNNYIYIFIYNKYIKRIFTKELYIFFYKQYIMFNIFKYQNIHILPLKKLIYKIYKKSIILNIINLKNYYLDSNITSQIIGIKAKKRKNKIVKLLKKALVKVETPFFSKKLFSREKRTLNIYNNNIKNNKELLSYNNNIDIILYNNFSIYNESAFDNDTLKLLKNKLVIGLKLKASGRLTRRFTAQRSICKFRYKGTLKNLDPAYRGISSKLLRNNMSSNKQFTKISSKNRIGAFGIKGWINSI